MGFSRICSLIITEKIVLKWPKSKLKCPSLGILSQKHVQEFQVANTSPFQVFYEKDNIKEIKTLFTTAA